MKISSLILILASISVLVISITNQFEFGKMFFGMKGAFLLASFCASIIASTVSYRVGYKLDLLDLKGKIASLALFLWLMLAFDLVFFLGGPFSDEEGPTPWFITLLALSPVLYLYYRRIKGLYQR